MAVRIILFSGDNIFVLYHRFEQEKIFRFVTFTLIVELIKIIGSPLKYQHKLMMVRMYKNVIKCSVFISLFNRRRNTPEIFDILILRSFTVTYILHLNPLLKLFHT